MSGADPVPRRGNMEYSNVCHLLWQKRTKTTFENDLIHKCFGPKSSAGFTIEMKIYFDYILKENLKTPFYAM